MSGDASTLCGRKSFCGLSFSFRYLMAELLIRIVVGLAGNFMKFIPPFIRSVYGVEWYNHYFQFATHEMFHMDYTYLMVVLTFFIIGIVTYITLSVWKHMPRKLIIEDAFNFLAGVSLSMVLTEFLVALIKNMYGRPRPDFLSRCLGDDFQKLYPRVEDIPAIPTCTRTDIGEFLATDGRRSFPSGHSSFVLSVIGYVCLFTYRKLCQIKNSGSLRLVVPSCILIIHVPILVSRTSDYRHFPTDVIAGSIIGAAFSILTWLVYDEMICRVYRDYCVEHDCYTLDGTYLHDPLGTWTPAQFVPSESKPKALAAVSKVHAQEAKPLAEC